MRHRTGEPDFPWREDRICPEDVEAVAKWMDFVYGPSGSGEQAENVARDLLSHVLGAPQPRCPPLTNWPDKNLIQGFCPQCGWFVAAARAFRAKRLIEECEPSP